VTSQISSNLLPSDYVFEGWAAAGLNEPSMFRTFLATMPATACTVIGHLTNDD
jgi:hypothetical protein